MCDVNHKSCVGMNVDVYFNWIQIEVGWGCPMQTLREVFPFWDASSLDTFVKMTCLAVSTLTHPPPTMLPILIQYISLPQ